MEEREYNYCLRCGRKLKSKKNRLRGYGDTCYEKSKASVSVKPLVVIGERNMSKWSDDRKQDYLNRLNKVRLIVTANETQYTFGTITKQEYQAVGKDILKQVAELEFEISQED